jgi:hypothetical protein
MLSFHSWKVSLLIFVKIKFFQDSSSDWALPTDSLEGMWSQYLYSVYWAAKVITKVGGEEAAPDTTLERCFMLSKISPLLCCI